MQSLGDIIRRARANYPARDPSAAPPEPKPPSCARCLDFGFFAKPLDLSASHPEEEVVPCSCRPARQPTGEMFEDFQLDDRYPSLVWARDAASYWSQAKGPPVLVLSAEAGRGKTHLARSAYNAVAQTGSAVRWMMDGELIQTIFGAFKTDTVDEWMKFFEDAPWLIIDDLGMTAQSDTIRGFIDRIIDMRWRGANRGLRTCYTTQLALEDFTSRISSRLSDTYTTRAVVIDAPDYRPLRGQR